MVIGTLSSLCAAALAAAVTFLWRNRSNFDLIRSKFLVRTMVRVSFSAILRVRDGDCYVLYAAGSRPSFSPPGGVFKYYNSAQRALDKLKYVDETRPGTTGERRRFDLRGFIPARSVLGFVHWFDKAAGRESAAECLFRETVEELIELRHPKLASGVSKPAFTHVRTVTEKLRREPGSDYLHLRRFEVYDLDMTEEPSRELRGKLIQLAHDPLSPDVVCVNAEDIIRGRHNNHLISGHAAFLLGNKRYNLPLPPLRLVTRVP